MISAQSSLAQLSLRGGSHVFLVSLVSSTKDCFLPAAAHSFTAAPSDSIHPWARLSISKRLFHNSAECSSSSMNYSLVLYQLSYKEVKSGSNTGLVVRGEKIRWRINRRAGRREKRTIEVYEIFRGLWKPSLFCPSFDSLDLPVSAGLSYVPIVIYV